MLRDHAAGKLSWSELRERGFEDYVQVLGARLRNGAAGGANGRRFPG